MSFVESFEQKLEGPYKSAKKKANIYGVCFGFAQCVIFMAYAASFTYGGYLVGNEGLPYMYVFRLVIVSFHGKSLCFTVLICVLCASI